MSTRLLFIIGVVAFFMAIYAYRLQHKPLLSSTSIKDGLAFTADNIGMRQVGELGNLSLQVDAANLSSRIGSDQYDLSELGATLYGERLVNQTSLTAPKASYDQNSGELILTGRVVARHLQPGAGNSLLSGGVTQLETDRLIANSKTNMLSTNSPVDVSLPAGALRVKSLSANLNSGIYQLNEISANYRP